MGWRGSVTEIESWQARLAAIQREMEHVSGERGPTKAENLVQYALEEVGEDLKRAREAPIPVEAGARNRAVRT